jgi:hypothetical protein
MQSTHTNTSLLASRADTMQDRSGLPVNALRHVDGFVTAEPTPKPESRRGWRRRRIRRGKS